MGNISKTKKEVDTKKIKKSLLLLIANQNRFGMTSKALGIPITTLRRWSEKYGDDTHKELVDRESYETKVEEVTTAEIMETEDVLDDRFMLLVKTLREKTVNKLIDVVTQAKDVKKLGDLLGTINNITSGKQPESPKQIHNYFTNIEQQYNIAHGIKKSVNPYKRNKQNKSG